MNILKEGLEIDPKNEDFTKTVAELAKEIADDNKLPADHPER
jgi:hypothetical protein